jgi:hypothetical protein
MIRGTQIASIGGKSNRGFFIFAVGFKSYTGRPIFVCFNRL